MHFTLRKCIYEKKHLLTPESYDIEAPYFPLIPPHRRQLIIHPFGHENLMQINNPVVEGRRTGAEIKFPHSGKLLVEHLLHLIEVFPVIFFPAAEGFIVMQP